MQGTAISFSQALSRWQPIGVGGLLLLGLLNTICTSIGSGVLTRVAVDSLEGQQFAFGACLGAGVRMGLAIFALQFSLGS
ncbi:hypothetical protein GW813_03630 [bacterium]|nr:hypothetical protein [bacterium]NCQ59080.1 hypothetical protein [Myxococcales bacterium]